MDVLGSTSSTPNPITIDDAEQDSALASSRFLTRQELMRRRLRRVKQLSRCYRGFYWDLMEDLKSKYRYYYWNYGKSPFKEDYNDNNNKNPRQDENVSNVNGNEKVNVGSDGVGGVGVGDDIIRCAFSGCKSKAMALTRYCHAHILSDSKQKLYRGCRTVVKNLPTGPSFCNKPILRSMVPPACPTHYQLGEKCLFRTMRRAGYTTYTIPINRKSNLRLHAVASEFVRQIQSKRKVALKETVPKVETE